MSNIPDLLVLRRGEDTAAISLELPSFLERARALRYSRINLEYKMAQNCKRSLWLSLNVKWFSIFFLTFLMPAYMNLALPRKHIR